MSEIIISPSQHILILGKTGSGKSVASRFLFQPALLKQPNQVMVVLDSKQEYTEIKDVVRTPKDLNYWLYGEEKPQGKAVRCFPSDPQEEVAEEYLRAAWAPWADVYSGDFYEPSFGVRFWIEDAPMFYDSAYLTPKYLKKWVCQGRSLNRSAVVCSQRAQLISKTVVSMVDHTFCFSLSEYDRKRVIKEYHGETAAAAVGALPKYGFVLISDLYDDPIVFNPYRGPGIPDAPKGVKL
tara:strand:+ start:594 stop:1307 length:714 start_codon:yes stop_codon:yes gene_type:complete